MICDHFGYIGNMQAALAVSIACGLVSAASADLIDPLPLTEPPAGAKVSTSIDLGGFAYTYDLSGVASWDAFGSINNEILSLDVDFAHRVVTRLSWDVSIQTVGASWLSEVTIAFLDSPNGLVLAPGTDNAPGTGAYSSNGIVDLSALDPTFPFSVGADGVIQMEVFESFDDEADAIDAVFLPGSTITFYFIPAPSSVIALAGATMLFARRRRH